MKFQIGDEVRYGPSSDSFIIAQIRKNGRHIQYASEPWHHWSNEDELCLVEPLKVGALVEVIGPCGRGYITRSDDPKIFKIDHTDIGGNFKGEAGRPGYPASSLRKVQPDCPNWQPKEPLKVGDCVEVIGGKWSGLEPSELGKIFRITGKIDEGKSDPIFSAPGLPWYKPGSLRKLSPEEVAAYMKNQLRVTVKCDASELIDGLEKAQLKAWQLGIEERLSAIEKRQDAQRDRMDGHGKGLRGLDLRVKAHNDQIHELNDGMALVRALSRAAKEARS